MFSLNDITYRIGPRILLDRASVALPPGARVGFVGRNGVGKTTLVRSIAGELELESGTIALPKATRLGRVEQEAPSGSKTLIEFVLAADSERSILLRTAETATDPLLVAEIQTRLVDIGAHAAPARAASILAGLGFDALTQQRPLDELSGGWRMRVALAAVLFAAPDLLLLDEPTNYLDLEGTVWLIEYLARYPSTILVISHDRDLLDAVSDHILHLDSGKLSLYRGNYTSFAQQRAEQQAIQLKLKKKQDDHRQHLQAFVDRFKAKASKARQAQSRLKTLAKMETVDLIIDNEVLDFVLPSPARALSPPIVAMESASVGYGDRAVLSRLNLFISNDDRIGLLGANGNGKSTLAKLIAGRLPLFSGKLVRAPKLSVGFFAQHQIDELDDQGTPYSHVARLMPAAAQSAVRARVAQMGFAQSKADTSITQLSGGEKARLLLGLASFHAPHLLIVDEPTNHLDIDSRSALIEAINAYQGAVVLISHDKYLLAACADQLWLVADATCRPFDGDLDDYKRLVLQKTSPAQADSAASSNRPVSREATRQVAAKLRKDAAPLRRRITRLEDRMTQLETLLSRVDAALARPELFAREPERVGEFTRQRAELQKALKTTEDEWLQLSAEFERVAAGD
jgi:ATP-binding cassette subfamily F protein 3